MSDIQTTRVRHHLAGRKALWTHIEEMSSELIDGGTLFLIQFSRYSELAGSDETDRVSESYLDILDTNGEKVRETRELTLEAGVEGNVDISTDEQGGAVVWTVGMEADCPPNFTCDDIRQIWMQQIDGEGNAPPIESLNKELDLGDMKPSRVLNSPFKGVDVSVVKLFTTYAVIYRQLPGGKGADEAQVVLTFIDNRSSQVLIKSDIALSTDVGGPVTAATAFDGRVVVGWTDLNEDNQNVMKLVRLPCVSGG